MKFKVLMVATSYPRSETDWQGVFIRNLASALSSDLGVALTLWAPSGPMPEFVEDAKNSKDRSLLKELSDQGGIAHLLKRSPVKGIFFALRLLLHLRKLYLRQSMRSDIFHINWLQNSIPLIGQNQKAVITVLGTDLKLLKIPGMVWIIRMVLKTNSCILCPNSNWMEQELKNHFGDLAEIRATNFGIDPDWYEIEHSPDPQEQTWICVQRITREKIGFLLDWGKPYFLGPERKLHMIGPLQDGIDLPDWVQHQGHASPKELLREWFPKADAFITLSQHSEGKPQVLLEAMASGIPIVASSISAHSELITDKYDGYLVKSPQDLERAVENLDIPNQRTSLGLCGQKKIRAEYGTWKDCAERFVTHYEELSKTCV